MSEKLTPEGQKKLEAHMRAFDCSLATCRHMPMPKSDECEMHLPCGRPEDCPGFDPEYLVRVARADSGEVYASRTDIREYLDDTLGWFKTQREAQAFIEGQK